MAAPRLFRELGSLLAVVMLAGGCGAPGNLPDEPRLTVGVAHHPPYSASSNGLYYGIDVDLARDLATYLGREVEFVPTRFSSVLADLVAGRFDVAVGGIHVTNDRAQATQISIPYMRVGRQIVVRCAEVARFRTEADISRLGVEVLATLGGASAGFATERFPRATILSSRDGPDSVRRLAGGEGDAVLMDAISAAAHTRREPHLCVGLGGAVLAEFPLAFLLAPNSSLTSAVNAWVVARSRDGTISEVVRSHSLVRSEPPMHRPTSVVEREEELGL